MRRLKFSLLPGIWFFVFNFYLFAGGQPGDENKKYVLVIHGGAGGINRGDITDSVKKLYLAGLEEALKTGEEILKNGGSSLDAVEKVIRYFEDDPQFNAGRGAVLTSDGTAELDASIMSGIDKSAGAVASVTRIKNPISAARAVMEKSPHVLLAGTGAEKFAEANGLELVDNKYFITDAQMNSWQKRKAALDKKGTVGAVAMDMNGNLAAGTSTGGMMMKMPGRIGDAPIIGAGTYADNNTCAVSCTGWGEKFIKNAVAFHVSALMEYKNYTLKEAVDEIMLKKLSKGDGGLIAIDKNGNYYMEYTTQSMFRGVVNSEGKKEFKIWED